MNFLLSFFNLQKIKDFKLISTHNTPFCSNSWLPPFSSALLPEGETFPELLPC